MNSALLSFSPYARRVSGALTLLALATTVLMTGCQLTDTATSDPNVFSHSGVPLKGNVYGGMQPIGGSVIQLYKVGISSGAGIYTGTATPLLTKAVTTDFVAGGFSISGDYTCGSGDFLYLTATGGSPDGNAGDTNPNIAEVVALGDCGSLTSTTSIFISEETTVAAAYALAQFATTTKFGTALSAQPGSTGTTPVAPADNIVTSTSNATGLKNAMSVAQVLANGYNESGGTPNGRSPGKNTNGGATAEYWTINTIADVLSACVNTIPGAVSSPTDGTVCGNLYKYTTPAGKTAPADIFQAALYLALYPTDSNLLSGTPSGSNLVNLIPTNAAYLPYVNTSVTGNTINDWTVAINYVPVITGTSTALLASPYYIAADSVGNIWEYDILQGTGSPASYVTETDPTGNPVFAGETACAVSNACVLKDFAIKNYNASTSSTTSVTIGQQPGNASPSGIAIDPNNNVWVSDRGGTKFNVFKITGSGSGSTSNGGGTSTTSSSAAVGYSLGTNYLPVGMAVDGSGNPWFTQYAKSGQTTVVAAPNSSCTSQTEPTSSTPQVLGTIVSGVAQIAGPGYSGGSLIAIDAGNPSCTVSSTTLCNTSIYDSLPATPTTPISGAPFIWIPFATSGTLPNSKVASFVGQYTTGNGSYTVPGCSSPIGFLGSPNVTGATPTTTIASINPSASDQIEYGSTVRTVAIGKNGYVWSINNNPTDASGTVASSLQRFLPNYGTAFTSASFMAAEASPAFSSYTGGGLSAGYAVQNMILDGSGGPWMTGNFGNSTNLKNTYVVQFSANGTAISPSTGISGAICTSGSTVLSRTTGQTSYGLAIDPSGNVWVADGDEGTSNTTTLTSTSMYEIVGAAAPVVTPLSAGVKYGTLATMP